MNWRLIFALSLFGVVMAVAGLFGLTRGTEPLLWLVIFIIYAICIAQYAGGKYFLHGFLVSLLNGVWIAIIHFAFFPMFLRNNPDVTGFSEFSHAHRPQVLESDCWSNRRRTLWYRRGSVCLCGGQTTTKESGCCLILCELTNRA